MIISVGYSCWCLFFYCACYIIIFKNLKNKNKHKHNRKKRPIELKKVPEN